RIHPPHRLGEQRPLAAEGKRAGRRGGILFEAELPPPRRQRAVEEEERVVAEQLVRLGGRDQLHLEEHRDDVLAALRRLLLGGGGGGGAFSAGASGSAAGAGSLSPILNAFFIASLMRGAASATACFSTLRAGASSSLISATSGPGFHFLLSSEISQLTVKCPR